jgi:hypothetical protein
MGGTKLVGAYVPPQYADYISLFALYRNTTSSDIIRGLIGQFIENELPVDEIIASLVSSAHVEWEIRLADNEEKEGWKTPSNISMRYQEYQREIRSILTKRKIPDNVITQILKHLKLMYEEDYKIDGAN